MHCRGSMNSVRSVVSPAQNARSSPGSPAAHPPLASVYLTSFQTRSALFEPKHRRVCVASLALSEMYIRSLTTLALTSAIFGICHASTLEGTDKDAEFLSAATKEFHDKHHLVAAIPAANSESRQATAATATTGNSSAAAFASQVTSALSQIDLGLGIYKMCPFPFSYLHQCEGSSDCPDSDCCGMYAFPGPNRWRRSCCVPDGVTTIARVARLCIKGSDNKNTAAVTSEGGSSSSKLFDEKLF